MSDFASLLGDESSPIILADEQGLILRVNDVFLQTFGWRREQLEGEQLSAIIPASFRDAHHMGFSRHLATGKSVILGQALSLEILTGDGEVLSAEHYILAGEQDGRRVYIARIRKE